MCNWSEADHSTAGNTVGLNYLIEFLQVGRMDFTGKDTAQLA